MKICDRSTARNGIAKRADRSLHFTDTDETFDLSSEEYALVRDFILNPNDWIHISQIPNAVEPPKRKRGRPSKAEIAARQQSVGLQDNP